MLGLLGVFLCNLRKLRDFEEEIWARMRKTDKFHSFRSKLGDGGVFGRPNETSGEIQGHNRPVLCFLLLLGGLEMPPKAGIPACNEIINVANTYSFQNSIGKKVNEGRIDAKGLHLEVFSMTPVDWYMPRISCIKKSVPRAKELEALIKV